jgi:hypothetical protein
MAWILGGCLAEIAPEPNLSERQDELVALNKITVNKITVNKITVNALGSAALSVGDLSSSGLMQTEDGRDVLSYVIGCALPASESRTVTYSGTAYTFDGSIGLAPDWGVRPPNVSERRWVTACLLARTNLFGVSVPISMRHDTNAVLTASPAEQAQYETVEGAFFGDLFGETQVWYACADRTWATTVWSPGQPLPQRACVLSEDGVTTKCDFTYVGQCNPSGGGSACSDATASFGACQAQGVTYQEVITTYLDYYSQG